MRDENSDKTAGPKNHFNNFSSSFFRASSKDFGDRIGPGRRQNSNGLQLATTNDPIPKAMQYVEEGAKSAMRKDKTANCKNCSQYGITHKELTHPKDGKVATCEIFPHDKTKLFAKAEGWCIGWQKKT
ncbi:MAG: high-potential iron-sulfur protein [Parachlamydiales bacterium]